MAVHALKPWHIAALLLLLWLALVGIGSASAQQLAPIPPLTGPVIDTTMTLDAATKQQLEAQALALQQRKGSQLQVLVVPTTQPEEISQYAVRAYDQYQLGRKGTSDGALLLVAKDDRRAWIATGYGLEGAIPDATAFRIIQEYLVPKFRAGDFNGGVLDASAQLVKLIDGETLPAPMVREAGTEGAEDPFGAALFGLFAAFVVAQVVRGLLGWAPRLLRGVAGAGAAGATAWLVTALVPIAGLGALIGLLLGMFNLPSGRYANHGGWGGFGGGGWGGGGFGGGSSGGGGWSGGGGMTGGGGAGGSW
ncbi:TPM domain-containing protein [Lysobacter fragariae]